MGSRFYMSERFGFKNTEVRISLQTRRVKIPHSLAYVHVATGGLVSSHFRF